MNDEILKKCGMEIAIEKIAPMIAEKIKEYKNNRDEKVNLELTKLLKDRKKIYDNDLETIKKYCEVKYE